MNTRQSCLNGVYFSFRYALPVLIFILLAPVCLLAAPEPPFLLPDAKELSKLQSAIIYTDLGDIKLRLYPKDAPWHVANLKYLADKDFFRNTRFHIIEPGFLVQGGARGMNGKDGPGYFLPPEFNDHIHASAMVGMARAPDNLNPERLSHAGQFYIMLRGEKRMDSLYTIFGEVVEGMNIVEQLKKGDYIRDLKVFVRPER